ncbi:hypothetical protein F4813DRAFT_368734 [Daldinia decipiens]|uniref:uncharacterized protein n=1 Tax=Daldinia decipiens TaxID=326647 RepID=UPI0020C49594|nr:uncharacterized protein F4813DRAFT_368734 [Daldinia decipiens]KAI1654867.1 hypothetical protein F4813DRAFT_368734 [Daldinia decipiens]
MPIISLSSLLVPYLLQVIRLLLLLSGRSRADSRLIQKGQAERLEELDLKALDMIKRFIEQRARGAYIASICQPEAAFDYSTAAQHTKPGPKEAKALNARIKWQVNHKDRGLRYMELDPQDLRLYVFVDGLFANNKDMSS